MGHLQGVQVNGKLTHGECENYQEDGSHQGHAKQRVLMSSAHLKYPVWLLSLSRSAGHFAFSGDLWWAVLFDGC